MFNRKLGVVFVTVALCTAIGCGKNNKTVDVSNEETTSVTIENEQKETKPGETKSSIEVTLQDATTKENDETKATEETEKEIDQISESKDEIEDNTEEFDSDDVDVIDDDDFENEVEGIYDGFEGDSMSSGDTLMLKAAENVGEYYEYAQQALTIVNSIRTELGLPELELDYNLCVAANMRAIELDENNYFSHNRPDGSKGVSVIDELGLEWSARAENLAMGQSSVQEVMEWWKESKSGHYDNMINAAYTKVGLGYSSKNDGPYWVQIFTD